MAAKTALSLGIGLVAAGVADKYLMQMTTPAAGQTTASLTARSARLIQVLGGAAVAIGSAAYNKPMGVVIGAAIAAPGAKPLYDAVRAPAAGMPYNYSGLPQGQYAR